MNQCTDNGENIMNGESRRSFLAITGKLLVGAATLGSITAHAAEKHSHGGSGNGLVLDAGFPDTNPMPFHHLPALCRQVRPPEPTVPLRQTPMPVPQALYSIHRQHSGSRVRYSCRRVPHTQSGHQKEL